MPFRYGNKAVLTGVIALMWAIAAPAAECKYGICWNAVAVGPDGRAGYATDCSTSPEAAQLALRSCGKTCNTVEVFDGGCGALATSRDGVAYLGLGATRASAADQAKKECSQLGTSCVVRVLACSR